MYRHLIFDLDGTVVDTISSITESLNITLKKFHRNEVYTTDDVKRFIGHGTPYLLRKAFKDDIPNFEEVMNFYIGTQIEIHLKKATIFPGLFVALDNLHCFDYFLYIATNKPIEVAKPIIDKLYGKKFFRYMIAQKKDMPKKPDPYVVNAIINRFHLKKEECMYIGDSDVDLLTAKNANIDACLVTYGYGFYDKIDKSLAKYVVRKPLDFYRILNII